MKKPHPGIHGIKTRTYDQIKPISQERGYGSFYAPHDTPATKTTFQAGRETVEVIAYDRDPRFVVLRQGDSLSHPMTPQEAYQILKDIAKG